MPRQNHRIERARKLHIGHFAFMRAVLQGLDTRASWERYLRIEGQHDDVRHVHRTIAWIRDEFAAAAQRHARHGVARLVRIDARRLPDREPPPPTLEEFAHAHGLQDFAQREQVEQYQAHYGPATRRQSRRERLIAKQLAALDWLERLVVQPPRAGDGVASWLHPDLAAHLERAGILTIQQLIDRINGRGMRWWTGIRAIGAAKGERIMEWLATHEATLGLPIGAHVRVRRAQLRADELECVVSCATGIVPLEKLIVPPALDGAAGHYRAPAHLCQLNARNDYEAVLLWIKAKRGLSEEQKAALMRRRGLDPCAPEGPREWLRYLSNTQRAYLKEAERFMLWAIVQHQKALSSMTAADCEAYRSFLASPAPAQRWCGPRGGERWSPLWRPFEGPLSPRAQQHAVTVLKSMYQFLLDQRYLSANPWRSVALPNAVDARINTARSFTHTQWRYVEAQLAQLPETSAHRRLRIALMWLYATGLRLGEVAAARVDDLNRIPRCAGSDHHDPLAQWQLKVVGKGGMQRQVPVAPGLVRELSTYLASRGLHPDPEHAMNRGAYLLGKALDAADRAPWSPAELRHADPKAGIVAGRLYKVLKAFLTDCAAALAVTDGKGAERFAAASTHWLRHTHGSHAVAAGTPLAVLQRTLGHASMSTTKLYAAGAEQPRATAQPHCEES